MNDSAPRGLFSRLVTTLVENWKVVVVGYVLKASVTVWVLAKYPVVKLFAIKALKTSIFVTIGTVELMAERIGLS